MRFVYRNRQLIRFFLILIVATMIFTCFSPMVFAESKNSVKLTSWNRTNSINFDIQNMLPGDSETKEYAITVSDEKAIAITMQVTLETPAAKLGEVLAIKVESNGIVLYDGLMRDMVSVSQNIDGQNLQDIIYKVTVFLDESVTNEYMGFSLEATFTWLLERSPSTPISPTETAQTTSRVEATTETTIAEATTEITTTETTTETTESLPIETTTETTTLESTPVETTTDTTTETDPFVEPPIYCCDCCVGYKFPYSCNFGDFDEGDVGCDLPWCCAGGNACHCPWCWIVPLIILIALFTAVIIVIRKLVKKAKADENEQGGEL